MLTYILTLISFGLLFPFTICYKQKWITKHTIINKKKIVFNGRILSLSGHYLLWYLLSIITFGIYGLWLPLKVYGWQVKNTHIKLKDEEEENTSIIPMIIGGVLALVALISLMLYIPKINCDTKNWNIFNIFDKAALTSKEGITLPREINKTVEYEKSCHEQTTYNEYRNSCEYSKEMSSDECVQNNGEPYTNWDGKNMCTFYTEEQ